MAKEPDNQPPSRNPADENDLEGLLRIFGRKLLEKFENRILVKVLSYDRNRGVVSVQPLNKLIGSTGEEIVRAAYQGIPVQMSGAGGMIITTPINVGDIGYLKSGDRDSSIIREDDYKNERGNNTTRIHSFSNGVFEPIQLKKWNKWTEKGKSAKKAQDFATLADDNGDLTPDNIRENADATDTAAATTFLGTLDGNSRLAMESGAMRIIATAALSLVAQNATFRHNLLAIIAKQMTMNGDKLTITFPNIEITGDIKITGNVDVQGTITASEDVVGGGISLKSHTHGGVETGGGKTGAPE